MFCSNLLVHNCFKFFNNLLSVSVSELTVYDHDLSGPVSHMY